MPVRFGTEFVSARLVHQRTKKTIAATANSSASSHGQRFRDGGASSARLAQVRSTGALLVLAVSIVLVRPQLLRIGRRELGFLAVFGIAGLAAVQLFYFLAIHRIEIGIALLLQYLAPLLVALW